MILRYEVLLSKACLDALRQTLRFDAERQGMYSQLKLGNESDDEMFLF